jgi:hypothetical protein
MVILMRPIKTAYDAFRTKQEYLPDVVSLGKVFHTIGDALHVRFGYLQLDSVF